jgi:hypothetical protein
MPKLHHERPLLLGKSVDRPEDDLLNDAYARTNIKRIVPTAFALYLVAGTGLGQRVASTKPSSPTRNSHISKIFLALAPLGKGKEAPTDGNRKNELDM